MFFRVSSAALAVIWIAGMFHHHSAAARQTPAAKTVWDGVYSEEQASRGATAYADVCAECHLSGLEGDGFSPALAGPEFSNNWNSLSLGDVFERIRTSMPPGQEDLVPAGTKLDILAYILQQNQFPAGSAELTADPPTLKQIQYVSHKPQ